MPHDGWHDSPSPWPRPGLRLSRPLTAARPRFRAGKGHSQALELLGEGGPHALHSLGLRGPGSAEAQGYFHELAASQLQPYGVLPLSETGDGREQEQGSENQTQDPESDERPGADQQSSDGERFPHRTLG